MTGMAFGNIIVRVVIITTDPTLRTFLWRERSRNAAESDIVPPSSSDKELCSFGQNRVRKCGTVYCRQRWNVRKIRSSILSSVLKNIFRRICIDTMTSLLLESELCVSARSCLDLFRLDLFLFQFGVGTFTVLYVF